MGVDAFGLHGGKVGVDGARISGERDHPTRVICVRSKPRMDPS